MDHLIKQSNKLYAEVYSSLGYKEVAYYNYIIYFQKEKEIKDFYMRMLRLKY